MIAAVLTEPQRNLLPALAAHGLTFLPPSYSCAQISKHDHFSCFPSLVSTGMFTRYDSRMTNKLELFLDFKEKLPHSSRQISK
jgi:hypothetical protein